jgi:Zn-dependent peptidase ImmA (M78 family)
MSGEQERREVGQRVREAMASRFGPERTQASIAEALDIPSDAFSRSLNGERAFSSGELARAAHLFAADLHSLITGRPDPLRAVVAARHAFDTQTFEYRNDGQETDREVREGVVLAYRQANPWLEASDVGLPSTPEGCREMLGDGFVPDFADRIEERLGVDVVRLPGLSTDYSLTIASQRLILLATQANWFRANWSLAHELAHHCLGHHEVDASQANDAAESAANAFAAELLLPGETFRALDWSTMSPTDVADFVWEAGVSTAAIRNRLRSLGLLVSVEVADWLTQSTQRFLNLHPVKATASRTLDDAHEHFITIFDPIGARMQRSAERRVPARLMKGLRDGVEAGRLRPGTLAWLLDVDPGTLELDEPDQSNELSVDDASYLLGL